MKIKYYNPKNLIVQHLPLKEKEKKIEIIRVRNGYNIDTLTSVDIQENVKIGGKVIEIYYYLNRNLGWKNFNSLRTQEDEPIYTYNDKYMRHFVRQNIKGGRVCSFNQYYKS